MKHALLWQIQLIMCRLINLINYLLVDQYETDTHFNLER